MVRQSKYPPATAAAVMVLTCCLALAACGDGGGVTSTPTPTPTPTPTATATPTPDPTTSPTTPASYQTITQVTQAASDRSFQSAGIQATYAPQPLNTVVVLVPSGSSTLAYGQGVNIAYNAAADSYTLTAPDGTTATFGPADINTAQSTSTSASWAKTTSAGYRQSLSLTIPQVNGVALSYTLVGSWGQVDPARTGPSYLYLANGGVPTLASDMPRTGTATYTMGMTGSLYNASGASQYTLGSNSTGTFSANFGAGTISTSLNLVGVPTDQSASSAPVNFGSFNGTGTIAANSPGFTGTFGSEGALSGTFNGPQAAEMGYSWYINSGTIHALGNAYGKKN